MFFWSAGHEARTWHVPLYKERHSGQLCALFPAGMYLTLTGCVYPPLQDIKEGRPNCLSSQVSSKINCALWEPPFPKGPNFPTKKRKPPWTAGSCLSMGMTSAQGLVTTEAGHRPEQAHSGAFMCCRTQTHISVTGIPMVTTIVGISE